MKQPELSPSARVFPGAVVRGEVTVGAESSIWYNAVVRGDIERISIGARTNIQDCCVVHADAGFPVAVATASPSDTARSSTAARSGTTR